MKSRTTRKFWRLFDGLSPETQEHARTTYRQWRTEPAYPSLQFKRVGSTQAIYSVRIGILHRALGIMEGDTVTWFWIGDHDDYERRLSS